jgi:ABC-type nitrate/sulfonate/bicarbonate transport system substrate-binding protein
MQAPCKRLWALLAAVVLAVGACTIARPAAAEQVVNYGVQPDTDPAFIAKALGLFDQIERKDHAKIVFREFSYGAPENEAMASGAIQVASAGMGPAAIATARLPATLVAINILEQTAIIVPVNSPITSVCGLKGKTVAFPGIGSQQYPLLLKALSECHLTANDIQLFKSSGPDIPILVEHGSVAAGITWDPSVSVGLASGKARVLIKAEKIMPIKNGHYIGNGVYVRDAFLAEHPDIVQDIVDANVKAIQFILKHPHQAAKLWSQQIGIPENVINYSLSKGISVYSMDVVPTKQTMDAYTAFLKSAGILKPNDNPKIDPRFAQKALATVAKR